MTIRAKKSCIGLTRPNTAYALGLPGPAHIYYNNCNTLIMVHIVRCDSYY